MGLRNGAQEWGPATPQVGFGKPHSRAVADTSGVAELACGAIPPKPATDMGSPHVRTVMGPDRHALEPWRIHLDATMHADRP